MKKTRFIAGAIIALMLLLTPAAVFAKEAGKVSVTSGNLNVRSRASTSSERIASLAKGSYVTLISRNGSWWYVEYADGKFGYCHADYITNPEYTLKTVKVSSGTLNVRSGPGTSYSRIGSLTKGEEVMVLKVSGAWSYVLYDGTKTGYVSSQYLSGADKYKAISLSVPDYKQGDSRWANVKLGSAGKLMRYIGCATCGIAMMESYRTGDVIHPDAMAKKLKYTSGGNVYWPSNFVAVTSKDGYLKAIYDKLAEGKPILIGAKTSAGKQHWVVITGYNGSDSLSASGFVINDPASKNRKTLQAFLNDYPIFYKYFYYK